MAGSGRRAPGADVGAPSPGRFVAVVVAVAVAVQAVVAVCVTGRPVVELAVARGGVAAAGGVVGSLLVLSVVAELWAVRLRHGEEVEELTLAESAAVACVLVLPPLAALVIPVAASLIASIVRRRGAAKLLFNAGHVGVGSAVLLASVHLVSRPGAGLSSATVLGLLAGMAVWAAANLLAVARLLALVSGEDPRRTVHDGMRLSAVMALGMTGLGATAVALAQSAPALLPFAVLPAAALTFAYRAAAQEAEERRRSSVLLALSQVLADPLEAEDVVASFARLSRQAFGADVATVLLHFDDGSVGCMTDDRVLGPEARPATAADVVLLTTAAAGAAVLPDPGTGGWSSALLAPLEADGRRLGALVVANRDRHRRLGPAELGLLTPLAAALAVALRGADHLRRLVEESSKLQAVVDRSSDGIVVLDGDGVVQLWSPAAQLLTGVGTLDALGVPFGGLVTARTADGRPVDAFEAGRALLSRDAPHAVVELSLERTDGEPRVVRCAHAGVFDDDGQLERDVLLLHDVTRERQVERLKADFIATVSHELRTPVTPIKGYADLLRRRGASMSPERRAECLEVISDRAAHLARLVEDLLLASRISSTEGASAAAVTLDEHDLGALVRRACGDFGDDGERLVVEAPTQAVPVRCDATRTVQVLGNLVGNALKYSPADRRVDVRLVVAGEEARVEVVDRGRGIPADQLDKVFDKFHRVEDPMRMTTGGTGLGLYIARQLAEAMGGRITCSSTLGVGSTFVLALPSVASGGGAAAGELSDGASAAVLPLPRARAATSR